MKEFGEQLRRFRHRCNSSKSPHGKLTQEEFGELVGKELGMGGYTGAAVSDWERGKSKIHDRPVLIAVVKVLYEHEGIKTREEVNQLLKAGNYRDLDPEEAEKIFDSVISDPDAEQPTLEQTSSKPPQPSLLENLFSSREELQQMITKAQDGPSPSWPRVLAAFMRKGSERISITPKSILWVWVWLLAWWLIGPSLRWPLADRDALLRAVGMYVTGTLVIPLLIGLLVNTKQNEYWKGHGLAESKLLRLYTYQGAGIGFNLGYFFVFPLMLVRYYLGFGASVWLEFAAVTVGLILGNMSARVVPHNLWRAYKRLHFADGAIFFVVALIGPLWGLFFLEFHSVLLTPWLGSMVILLAFTLFVIIAVRQSRRQPPRTGKLK